MSEKDWVDQASAGAGQGGAPAPGWWLASDGRWYPPEQASGQPAPAPGGYGQQPAYGQPGQAPQPGYGYAPPYPVQSTNGLAIASMVLGILWIYWIGSVLALVLGYIARGQIKRSGGAQSGGGMAIAGIVLGWIGVAVGVVLAVVVVVALSTDDGINSDPSDGYCNSERYLQDPDC